jgi:hypothetical protein
MFDLLFVKPRAVARHSAEPLPDERRRFLAHLKECGLPRVTLRWHAEMLLRVAETLRLADRPGEVISRAEIHRRATDKRHKFVSHEVSRVKCFKALWSWNLTTLPFALALERRALSWSCQVKAPILRVGPQGARRTMRAVFLKDPRCLL